MPRQIFHLDLDAFFVSVEQALNPSLKGKPVVVGGQPSSRGVVACASYEARALGVRTAMPLAQAQRLCPQAVFLPGQFARYQEATEGFMAILRNYTPQVQPGGNDEAFLDLTGFEPLYGPARQTAQTIKGRIQKELGLTASVGIATSKVVSKVASDLEKPDGLVEVAPGQEASFLAPLAVGRLPMVGPRTEQALGRWGIATVGQLASLPLSSLQSYFGKAGFTLYHFARGIDASPVISETAPAKSISRSTTFPQDLWDRRLLKAALYYLSERVGAQLRREGQAARCVTLKVRYEDFLTIGRSRTLRQPSDAHQAFFAAAWPLLEQALERRRSVRLVGIGVSRLTEGEHQALLWPDPGERVRHLNQAVDSMRQRYGFTALRAGLTLPLSQLYPEDQGGLVLQTPCLSR
ncbi:MAG: DNA polymerase IV [Chloroflexi bacterium]|nr:DNA polymerase IV [Chloroflexota bacterium]